MKVFISHTARDRDLAARIATHLALRGDEVSNPFSEPIGSEPLAKIFSDVRSADLVIALLSAPTPNVYYELGLAVGAGLPVLIASPASAAVAADLAMLPSVQIAGDFETDAQLVVSAIARLHPIPPRKVTSYGSAKDELRAALGDTNVFEALAPRKFELLVAEFFRTLGYQVEGASEGKDSGFDFSLRDRDGLFLVEVRKMLKQTRIAVDVVRSLVASVRYHNARGGILIAPSGFTSAAQEFAQATPVSLCTLDEVLAATRIADLWRDGRKN